MKLYSIITMIVLVSLLGCAREPQTPVELVKYTVAGKWVVKRDKPPVETELVTSTTQREGEYTIYPESEARIAVTLDRELVQDLIQGLNQVPEMIKGSTGLNQDFIYFLFESRINRQQRLTVTFYREKGSTSLVAVNFEVKIPSIPNSLFKRSFLLTPEKAQVWQEQLKDLLGN